MNALSKYNYQLTIEFIIMFNQLAGKGDACTHDHNCAAYGKFDSYCNNDNNCDTLSIRI